MDPDMLKETGGLPELLRFENGDPVRTPGDWTRRRAEILDLYGAYVYGYMPDRASEKLSWSLEDEPVTGGTLLNISVSVEERSASFAVLVGLPPRPAS